MKKRNPAAVFFLSIITLGIYALVWDVKTKNEMNQQGASIPTAWLLIVPFISLYWYWKYCVGVEKVTNGKISAVVAFILLILLGTIGMAIIQNEFNSASAGPNFAAPATAGVTPSPQPTQTVAPVQPGVNPVAQPQPQPVVVSSDVNPQPPQPPAAPTVS